VFYLFWRKKGKWGREKREERRRNEEEGRRKMDEAITDNPPSPKGLRS
jgi:hypothetical protein